jgi:hypothetical protein
MDDPKKMPPDSLAKAMNAAIPRYGVEKSMLDPDKNPLDSLIKPEAIRPEDTTGAVQATVENP